MRGEITRAYLYNFELSEEEILYNYFKCDGNISNYNQSLVNFEWSNVLVDENLAQFKKIRTNFCKCKCFNNIFCILNLYNIKFIIHLILCKTVKNLTLSNTHLCITMAQHRVMFYSMNVKTDIR